MKLPLAWLRDFVELPADAHRIAELLAQLGFPVESIEERPTITGVVVGRILALRPHPNADRLQVGTIDVGAAEPLTIATAATNVAQGQTIPVATVGAQLPKLTIARRKMRGLESEGMMVSADELALPPEWFEDGIMQLDANLPLGANVVELFGLSEPVLDVEVTSNRVDAMSVLGLARELAAALRTPLRFDPPVNPGTRDDGADAPRVNIETPDCRRFVAQRFTNVRGGAAPSWIRIRLALAGQRPIDNVVDISNYVMLEIGQPLHFYDDDALPNHHLIVRDARAGERLQTLDDVEHELQSDDLVIAGESDAEGLAGLKGGARTQVRTSTTSVLLEAATFAGARVRRMSARLGFRTEASARHEKGLPTVLADWAAARAAQLLVTQGAFAYRPHVFGEASPVPQEIEVPFADIRRLLGFELSAMEVREALDALGFAVVEETPTWLRVAPPPWRRDVTIPADVIEEIARLAGYDRIEAVLPAVAAHGIPSSEYELERRIAHRLAALGYHEIVSYSLHGASLFAKLRRAGIEPSAQPVEVLNPLSEDQRYLRYALGPAILEYLARIDRPARIFEMGHIFANEAGPSETSTVTFAFTAEPLDEPEWRDSHFLRLKGDCRALLAGITGRSDFECVQDHRNGLHPGKTAAMMLDGREVATIGAVDPRLLKSFEVRLPAYICSMYLQNVPEHRVQRYRPASRFPSTYRDLALVCDVGTPAETVERIITAAAVPLARSVRAFDEYRGAQVPQRKKSLAVRVVLQRDDATITDDEADAAVAAALGRLERELGVVLRA